MKLIAVIFLVVFGSLAAFGQNEQAPILEKDIAYKDWTLKGIRDDKELNLRELSKGKKLVAIVYFAPWCHNWQHDAPMLQRLYDKYKDKGFEIVAIGEYDQIYSMRQSLDSFKITFPAVYESTSRDQQATLHYAYRRSTGDTRNWGSVYYVFLEPPVMNKSGDLLVSRTNIINGEMIEQDGEKFIREKLGLPAEVSKLVSDKKKAAEVCDPQNPVPLKKPADKP